MFTREFWKAAGERAIATFGQTFGATVLVAGGVLDWDWVKLLSIAAAAAILSVAKSVGAGALTDGSPSLTGAETITDTPGKHAED